MTEKMDKLLEIFYEYSSREFTVRELAVMAHLPKSTVQQYLSLLKKDLSSNYSLGTTSADLASDSRPDTIVIVGKE